jgi:hypothetical protein
MEEKKGENMLFILTYTYGNNVSAMVSTTFDQLMQNWNNYRYSYPDVEVYAVNLLELRVERLTMSETRRN